MFGIPRPFFVCANCLFSEMSKVGTKEMFYLTTHSAHFIKNVMESAI